MGTEEAQISDENITMLMGMGFSDIDDIRRALRLAKNDINEAVAILTGEDSRGRFDSHDIEMKEVSQTTELCVVNNNNALPPLPFGPHLPNKQPEESMETVDEGSENIEMAIEDMPEEFPTTHMYELEDRVFREDWSIPYKKNESLAKCLYGAIKLTSMQKAASDKDCACFMDRALIESFKKLLTSQAVKKWTSDILEGVFNMIKLFIDLISERLKYTPVPVKLLETLTLVFDPDSEFHFKNRTHKWDRGHYEDVFGYLKCPAMSPNYDTNKEPFGWLVDLINRFVQKGGLDCIIKIIESTDKLSPSMLACLLKPFGACSMYLNPEVVGYQLGGMADKVVHFINDMKDDDMKEKEADKVYDLLRALYAICKSLWPDKTSTIVELHLNTILKMLKLPHFNSRMNAVKELSKLIKDADNNRSSELTHDVILQWLIDNKALSIAFLNSLHQAQYCDKLQNIVEFAGTRISLDELSTIWKMQSGKHITIIDNIHSIISSAAQNFSTTQMEHFISLLEKSWEEEDDKSKERLLLLIGKVGREVKDIKIVTRFLELLWEFSHIDDLQLDLVNQAVQSHIDVLTESNVVSTSVKVEYVASSVQDINNNVWVVPAIRHIFYNLQSITKQPFTKNSRAIIQEIQSQHELLKLLSTSLIHSHKEATNNLTPGSLCGETVIGNRYKYAEIVITHLKLIEFLLQEGGLYLSWNRCKDLWDCMMLDANNCDGDYETCFEWFLNCISDLNAETQRNLFTQKILKTDVVKLKEIGFKCLKSYFETVNITEHKVRRVGPTIIIEKQELTGLSYLWQVILESPYNDIAKNATKLLINASYSSLAAKLKKHDQLNIHKRFISECHKRLEFLLSQLKDNEDIGPKEGKIIRTFRKPQPLKGSCQEKSKVLLSLERLLNLANQYIIKVEENYVLPRSSPPHGSCFHGYPITIHVKSESNKPEFDVKTHSNERFEVVRLQIATRLDASIAHLQIYKNDSMIMSAKDHKLLSQLDFEKKQNVNVKVISSLVAGASNTTTTDEDHLSSVTKPSSLLEREKCLPSYILAVEYKVFDKLYQLAELEHAQITSVLCKLIQQLPTDGDVLNAIDIFSFQNPLSCSPGTRAGYASTSSSVLENYFKCSAPQMSTFRVLYNLQVLSSKLMPVLEKDSTNITHSFRENWLNAGGLGLIMNILLPDTLPSNADYELRQSCYYIILQLARFLLCGETNENASDPTAIPNLTRTYGQANLIENFTSTTINSSGTSQATSPSAASAAASTTPSSTPIKINSSPQSVNQIAASAAAAVAIVSSWPGAKGAFNDSPGSTTNQISSSPGSAASFTPDGNNLRRRLYSTSSVLESVSPTVKMVIENINEKEFNETISSLVQVTWSAAAGQLQLNTCQKSVADLQSDNRLVNPFTRQQSSQEFKAGLCLQQESVSEMDSVLSNSSLELLVMCLQLRLKLINVFYQLPNISEFIVDILTGSPSLHVRTAASLHLYTLSTTEGTETLSQNPKEFLINTLIKAKLPVWNISGTIRGASYKILLQCQQYFELLSSLVCQLSIAEQKQYNVNPSDMLEEELNFLSYSASLNVEMVLGHLKLSNALLTCEGVQKDTLGHSFAQYLLDEFLFSASKLQNMNTSLSTYSVLDINIHSFNSSCRKEAFDLLLTTSERCPTNIKFIADELTKRHHSDLTTKEWNFQPPISSRPANGFVGLCNAGATCYMNSILQQLYMQPGLKEAILKIDDSASSNSDTILSQTQNIFGHLLESQTQYFRPEGFWQTFKLWGEPVNVREQQDALEFYTNITDQLDEHLKTLKKAELFKEYFSGMFVDQKLCEECSHSFEQDESFSSLPVTVNNGNLEASLEQFVHNEIMEGDNAYKCEKCSERRTTVKRTCIKKLPPILVIQLKRFWYDWERNRAIKFDDCFKFPFVLDMEPYTLDGIKRKDAEQNVTNGSSVHEPAAATKNANVPMNVVTDNGRYYELIGVIVHSGQASAGHYYSYIKNRLATVGEYNKWYKFNDTSVERFEMTEEALQVECFGGDYKVTQAEGNNQYPENRTRNWNAYMLFYETMDKSRLPSSPAATLQDVREQMLRSYPVSPCSSTSSNPPSPGSKDSLSQLSALIRKGEKKGLFNDNMPAYIKRNVNEENKQFMYNRDIYNEEYFQFVRELCSTNAFFDYKQTLEDNERNKLEEDSILSMMKLAIHFLINTYFKTAKSFRSDIDLWSSTVESIMARNRLAGDWFLEFFVSDQGKVYLVPYLLECPDRSNREAFCGLVYQACNLIWRVENKLGDLLRLLPPNCDEFDELSDPPKFVSLKVTTTLNNIIVQLLSLLDNNDVVQYIKNASEYFLFFYKYSSTCPLALSHLSERNCFGKMHRFLLGPKPADPGKLTRRWTSAQASELTSLHNTMASIIINTSVEELHTVTTSVPFPPAQSLVQYPDKLKLSADIREHFFEGGSYRYVHECLQTCIELPAISQTMCDVILYGCWCNLPFTITFLREMQRFLSKASDFKQLFSVLNDVLNLSDEHQQRRIELFVNGSEEHQIDGVFNLIHTSRDEDISRAYQCIKFLVTSSSRFPLLKDYLLTHCPKWQWAVDWLKKTMSEMSAWTSKPEATNDNHTSFQRTISAQNTLDEATKLLTEIESYNAKQTQTNVIIEEEVT